VTPVSALSGSCLLSITATLIGGGGAVGDQVPNAATTFVFFDIESSNATLSAQLLSSSLLLGSRSPYAKSDGYNGSLLRAQALGNGQFGVSFDSRLLSSSVGVSLIMGTTDPSGVGGNSRTTPLLAMHSDLPVFSQPLNVTVAPNELFSLQIISRGYSPFIDFEASLTTQQCLDAIPSTATTSSTAMFFTSDVATFTTEAISTTSGIVDPPASSLFSQTIGSSKIAALIAIAVLLLALLCFLCHSFWKRMLGRIIFSFTLSLLCAISFWVFTSERENFFGYQASDSTCQITGGFLHYFFLASFMFVSVLFEVLVSLSFRWLCVEFFDQYLSIVIPPSTPSKLNWRYLKYSAFGWGMFFFLFVYCLIHHVRRSSADICHCRWSC
jgi:hypothetical protein